MAWTRAHLKVEAGERYLIDFSAGTSHATFTVGTSDGQNFTVSKGSHHLLLYPDAKSTTTSLISLTSDNTDWLIRAHNSGSGSQLTSVSAIHKYTIQLLEDFYEYLFEFPGSS
jgi:hypothetical protein